MENIDIPDTEDEDPVELANDKLRGWLVDRLDVWRNYRDEHYLPLWKEYDRLWKGKWRPEDKIRGSERSRFVAPAIAQAVDSAVAEIEEATFGRGKPFALEATGGGITSEEIVRAENNFYDELQRAMARKSVSECVINAAVFGVGIAEIIVENVTEKVPMEQPDPADPSKIQVGFGERERVRCFWKAIQPNNFLIDPNSSTVEDALGVAVEEYVSRSVIERGIAKGIYRNVDITSFNQDSDMEKDLSLEPTEDDQRVKLTRYFGLVPRALLFPEGAMVEGEEEAEVDTDDAQSYVEAIIVMLNDEELIKVEENPFMMKDRPIVAFSWDLVPNRFWGRGVVEKGYNAQKALDAEIRNRHDSLALTTHPMMAIDAARMPRGFKFEIAPGKNILTNGNPAEILMPFKFGNTDQNSYVEAEALEKMVFQATGAVDLTGIPGQINGDATAAGMSMSLSGAIKRFKRTLLNFHEQFFIPALEKTMWRYNELDPENYPAHPLKFKPATTLGLIAREYETAQMVQLMNSMSPEDPARQAILTGIIENSSLPNRAELIEQINPQPSPEEQQAQQEAQEMQKAMMIAELQLKQAQARKASAEAVYWEQIKPHIDMVNAMAESRPDAEGDRGFKELVEVAKIAVQEKRIDELAKDRESNERITMAQMQKPMEKSE